MALVFYENANETATLTNTFSVAGVATDPSTVSLTVTDPAGAATTYTFAAGEITKTSTGVYTKNVACSQDGTWLYLWVGTGAVPDAQAGTWTVLPVDLDRYYCTLDQLKTRVGEALTETRHDFRFIGAIADITTEIDDHCERSFRRFNTATARTYPPVNAHQLDTADFWTSTDLTLKTDDDDDGVFETTWAAADYELIRASDRPGWPYFRVRAVGSRVFPTRTRRRNVAELTAKWGWETLPTPVNDSALIMGEESFRLADSPFGVGGYGQFGIVRVRDNPFVARKLGPYLRYPVKVA